VPLLLLFLQACAPESPPAAGTSAEHPEGTVLLVDEQPLTAGEMIRLTADIRQLYPEYSLLHARRLALTNEFLPRLAARAREPERWSAARTACMEANDELEARATRVEGRFHGLGLSLWSAARHLPVGEWSAPLDLPGRWVRLRLDERLEAADPREEFLRVSLVEFGYLAPAPNALEEAIDHARLTVIDPSFGEAVPEQWKHRMRGSRP
jgi:hypothetical protein